MSNKEILNKVKEFLSLSKQDDVVEDINVELEEVVSAEIALAEGEDVAKEAKQEPAQEVVYATAQEVAEMKNELLSMIKAIIESGQPKETQEVPQELSAQVELKEEIVEEIVHSPENVEKNINKTNLSSRPMTELERVQYILNN
jgi:hypothetical protein